MILDFLFGDDDVPSATVDNTDRPSTPLRDPPIGMVCRLLREESLPMHYSRRIFTYNLSRPGTFLALHRWAAKRPAALQRADLASRVTFRGRTVHADPFDDYWEITIDFQCLMLLGCGYFDRAKDTNGAVDSSEVEMSLGLLLARRAILNAQYAAHIEQAVVDSCHVAAAEQRPEWSPAGRAFVEILRVCPAIFRVPIKDQLRLRLACRSMG